MKSIATIIPVVIVAGCAGTNAVRTSQDTAIITAQAAPVCGGIGAQRVAQRQAAIETLKAGYDRYIIYDAAAQNTVEATQMPGSYQTTGMVGGGVINATTVYQPGPTIYSGNHSQAYAIKMFRESDAGAPQAISARQVLGPKWPELMKGGSLTTCAQ